MNDDLVKRLRDGPQQCGLHEEIELFDIEDVHVDMIEAADRIEALEVEVERLRAEIKALKDAGKLHEPKTDAPELVLGDEFWETARIVERDKKKDAEIARLSMINAELVEKNVNAELIDQQEAMQEEIARLTAELANAVDEANAIGEERAMGKARPEKAEAERDTIAAAAFEGEVTK